MTQTRYSRQRSLILSLMKDNYNHPTADELYALAHEQDPKISRGTVYRNLNLLADLGKIRKMTMIDGPDHFDCRMENHYHFLCRRCGSVFDTPLPYDAGLNQTPDLLPGFKIEWHSLLLVGLCPNCAEIEISEKTE